MPTGFRAGRSRQGDPDKPAEHNSLFGEILDWMLAPLLFIWPISIAVTHHVANDIANAPYDQALGENLKAVTRLVRIDAQRVQVNFPAPARAMLRADEQDTIYYQVKDAHGALVVGDPEITSPEAHAGPRPEQVYYRDDEALGEEIRVAYQYLPAPGGALVLVQVAETKAKRAALANRIVAGVLLPQFAIIPLAVALVYVGLGRGLAPLARLRQIMRRRRPSDLSPLAMRGMPKEVGPVIDAFNAMMARLEQNLHAQQRFIADAAHQMRTPLTGLKIQADLALSETDAAQIRDALARISSSADRAAHLIAQLLALARADASYEQARQIELIDLERLIPELARDMAPQALARRIDFGVELSGWPLLVEGNSLQLREAFSNLIDNAIKYTPEGGKVTARTIGTHNAIVEIEDSGIGIAESDRELVFERFYRALGTGAQGSGLGLAIVREIVALHRGSVQLKPAASGRGTVAQVVFPRRRRITGAPPGPDAAFPLA